jgi:hypothetical protein
VHDFHPPIAPSGLYWIAPVPPGGLTLSPDGREATLELKGITVIDQPGWPAHDAPSTAATMSFRVIWQATDERVTLNDKEKHFRFDGFVAMAQAYASVEVPSLDFSWKSDPISTSKAAFAIMGKEVNGRYYDG